ncbi:hypothetical protein D3C87_1933380 [compost metagenome]
MFGYSSLNAAITWLYRSARTSLPQNDMFRVTFSFGSKVGFASGVPLAPPAQPASTRAEPAAIAATANARFLLNIVVLS